MCICGILLSKRVQILLSVCPKILCVCKYYIYEIKILLYPTLFSREPVLEDKDMKFLIGFSYYIYHTTFYQTPQHHQYKKFIYLKDYTRPLVS